jgi:hypothetical protein
MATPGRFENIARGIAVLIARGEYAVVQRMSGGLHLSASDLAAAVAEYGRQVVEPPADATLVGEIVELPGAASATWRVRASLWTAEEGRSGLGLRLTLRAVPPSGYHVEVDGLDVA